MSTYVIKFYAIFYFVKLWYDAKNFEMVLLKVDVIFTFDRLFLEKYRSPEFMQLSATLAYSILVCWQLFLQMSYKLEWGRTWITQFEPKMWNIYDISEHDIWRRINNYLECYNCYLNEQFSNSYPNLFAFIAGIQK
ncbi:hypothetical protein MXB_5199, partial [Myxobolus squamalis]